jgi:ubiquinone/menaquinone biosynthesis C-methylase UbiE
MVAILGFNKEQIIEAVKDMYTVVATKPETPLHFPTGPEACLKSGYNPEDLKGIPTASLESFAGVGNPFQADVIKSGQTVLDIGSGSGTDVLIAAKKVGKTGKVYALDLTPAMRKKLTNIIEENQITNVEVLAGDAENIPLENECIDVVTSNGVINLVPDKRRAIREIARVLKPNGYMQLADIVIAKPVTPDCEDDPKMWAECVVGATIDEVYLQMFRDAGFEKIDVLRDYDYFSYSPSQETREVAKQFGAHAYELRLQRKSERPSLFSQWLKQANPYRWYKAIQRRGLWGTLSLGLSLLTCYGLLALITAFSALGITISLNEHLWAAGIILFAVLACIIVSLGLRKYKSYTPLALATLGAAVLIYTMYVHYNIVTELIGFIILAAGIFLDYRKRRWASVIKGKNSPNKKPLPTKAIAS